MARLKNKADRTSEYDPIDGMADSIAREAMTSHPAFRRSQTRVAAHLKKTAQSLARGFMPSKMNPARDKRRRNSVMTGHSRGKPYRSH